MAAARFTATLPDPYSSITLYTDISAATTQKRREFALVTAILRDCNITYKWGYTIKLVVTFQQQTTNLHTQGRHKKAIKLRPYLLTSIGS